MPFNRPDTGSRPALPSRASPRLGQNEPDRAPQIVFCGVERGGRLTRIDGILEWGQLVHEVLDDELDADILQIIALRQTACRVSDREIDRVVGRLQASVIADGAGK